MVVADATDETNARAEAEARRTLAAERARESAAESGGEHEFHFYRLLPAQSPPSAADSGGDRFRAKSRELTRAAPAAAPSAAEGGESYALIAGGGVESPADYREQGRDRFADFESNPVKVVAEEPVSTFSIDVDTASYGFVRASLNDGVLPQKDAVRVEELVNYFPYDYPGPENRETPFRASVSLLPAPWNPAARLMHIGIKGYALDTGTAPRANLVFLVDVSGSMDEPDKLPLVVNSLKLLLGTLAPEDTVAVVVYAGAAGTVLPPTPVAERGRILAALEHLDAGGSTAGGEGIRQAYLLAERHFVEGGINRVILATDGDFNVGITDSDELESFIARKRESGVFLSVLGFGMGNYNDALMQRLAQHGNGNAAYIDSLNEARKALVEESTSMLFPIAKDVKIQVEFNPAAVSEYRLIGYETRMLAREDFRNDRVDAGEIGSGHTVTAIYEVVPVGSGGERIAPLRYQREEAAEADTEFADELAFLKIRYKRPDADTSILITRRGDHRRRLRERGVGPARSALRDSGGGVRTAPPGRSPYRRLRLRRRHRPRSGSPRRRPLRLPGGVHQPRPSREVRRRHGAPPIVLRFERDCVCHRSRDSRTCGNFRRPDVSMEQIVNLRVERLPEGVYLATSDEVPGLVAQGRTVAETLEIARDVARKLLEARAERLLSA